MTERAERERTESLEGVLERLRLRRRRGPEFVSPSDERVPEESPWIPFGEVHAVSMEEPTEAMSQTPDPSLLPAWVRERGFQFEPQRSSRVIRVRKGAAEDIEKELHPTLREGDGVPTYSIFVQELAASVVNKKVEKMFTEGELANTLWQLGFDEVVIHTTRHTEVDLDILGELSEVGKKKLHIFGGAIPSSVRSADQERRYIQIEPGDPMELRRRQRPGYITTSPGWPMFRIKGTGGDDIAIGGPNFLMVVFNIFGAKANQPDILLYLIRRWLKDSGIYDVLLYSQTSMNELSRDKIVELFQKIYDNIDPDSQAVAHTKASVKAKVANAFNRYRNTVREHADTLRFLEGKEKPDDETIAQRAGATFEALAANPLLTGVKVFYDTLEVVTKPLRSELYWKGEKRLVMTLPLYYRGDDSELRVRELNLIHGIVDLPHKEEYIFDDGAFCLGTLRYSIDTNMLMGEWNMAVLLILRGLLGRHLFRAQLKKYNREVKK